MAGSRSWFIYEDDDENQYAVEMDEDLAGVEGSGFVAYSGAEALTLPPKGLRMRYVNAVQTSGSGAGYRSRRVFCATTEATLYGGTTTTFELNGLNYSVTSKRGERARIPTATNTGLVGESNTVGDGEGTVQ